MSADTWKPASAPPPLAAGINHIWRISLTGTPDEVQAARALLSNDELARADRFIFEKHRHRFTLGRAALRQILSGYVGQPAARLVFEYEGLGKPRLAGQQRGEGLCFNFSNSHELALLAVTEDVEVGIDLEWHRDLLDMMGLAKRFFCAAEINTLDQLDAEERREAFFRCWTRKEAFLKAVGKGLTFPLDRVEVSCRADDSAEIRMIDHQPADEWTVDHLRPGEGYVGAVARPRRGDRIEQFAHVPR